MKNITKTQILILVLILILIAFVSMYIYKWENRKPLFEINFFSLNRGRSIFIRSPDNTTILIGGGQNTDTIRELTKVMPFYIKKINYIFIPSATPAQIGGLLEIIERYDVDEIYIPKYIATSTVLNQLIKKINNKKIHMKMVERGDKIEIGNLNFEVMFPNSNFKYNKTSLPELALRVDYKNSSVFLMGNVSKTIQKYISKEISINHNESLVEFYNSAIDSKVNKEFISIVKPIFIFSTKEKTTKWISDGFSFKKIL